MAHDPDDSDDPDDHIPDGPVVDIPDWVIWTLVLAVVVSWGSIALVVGHLMWTVPSMADL